MVRKKEKGNMKRKNKFKDCPERSHYEEFGEAHPLEDKDNVKRMKVEDTDENEGRENPSSDDDVSSDEEQEETDAVSRLLATFNANANTAIDSDDDEEDDDDEDNEDDDDGEGNEVNEDEVDSDQDDVADGMLSSDDNEGPEESDRLIENSSEHEEESSSEDDALDCEVSLELEKKQKKPLTPTVMASYLDFGFKIINDEGVVKPQCVLCLKILSAKSLLRPSKLKLHLVTAHSQHVGKDGSFLDRAFFARLELNMKRQGLEASGSSNKMLN